MTAIIRSGLFVLQICNKIKNGNSLKKGKNAAETSFRTDNFARKHFL